MAGLFVPLVLVPRYTTVLGNETFTTIGMDVSDYERAIVSYWRSTGVGAPAPTIFLEESMDQVTWSACAGGPFADPGPNVEAQFNATITKRWFRLRYLTGAVGAGVTFWMIGFLEQRET
jgi:hypothetical protein